MGRENPFGLEDERLSLGGLDRYIEALGQEYNELDEEELRYQKEMAEEAKAHSKRESLLQSTRDELKRRFKVIPQYGDENKVEFIAESLVDHLGVKDDTTAYDRIRRLHAHATMKGGRMAPLDSVLKNLKTELSRRGIQ